jgi:putative hydrolase of the HAD superfamily
MPHRPQIFFLDAVDTLFQVKGSVGDIYAQWAQRHGVTVAGTAVQQGFRQAFSQPRPRVNPAHGNLAAQEYQWWRSVVQDCFKTLGVLNQFQNFDTFFADLFHHFATAEPWELYPEAIACLQTWKHQGFQLGMISNFDSRLSAVLKALDLDPWFDSVTLSTQVGHAKPAPEIFRAALDRHGLEPHQALHIGDSWQDDVLGAQAVGIQPVWLKRDNRPAPPPPLDVIIIPTLDALEIDR